MSPKLFLQRDELEWMPLLILVLENLISTNRIYAFWCCLFALFYFVIIASRLYDIPDLCIHLQPTHTFESLLFNWLWILLCIYVKGSLSAPCLNTWLVFFLLCFDINHSKNYKFWIFLQNWQGWEQDRWFTNLEHLMVLLETQVQFPVSTLDNSKL